ncbi:cysteine hydrolase family protein [Desertivirga brevis]|uniref:cysteine hydrolase family protein n=1 Tax=Desertivirga brevis TaxID=2810310 RepID=UPI001A95E32C|nr:cysteine hydrolase family protein [Pedobacter sp. SYSU D00873]
MERGISKFLKPALILIDIQKAFDNLNYWGGQRNNPNAENNASKLLKFWRDSNLPIFHIKHCSSNPVSLLHESNEGNEFKEIVEPIKGERIIKKSVNSAFINTDLKELLDWEKITQLVIVGLTTDHCVSTTVRMAGNYGYETYLVSDATATFNKKGLGGQNFSAELIHETALASLKDEFATVISTDLITSQYTKGEGTLNSIYLK